MCLIVAICQALCCSVLSYAFLFNFQFVFFSWMVFTLCYVSILSACCVGGFSSFTLLIDARTPTGEALDVLHSVLHVVEVGV